MSNPKTVFYSLEELVKSDLNFDEKIKILPILIISTDSDIRDGIGLLFQKNGFKRIITAKSTQETILQLKRCNFNALLKFSISEIDLGEKYFYKEDFDNLPGFESNAFWKNCIDEKIMTIIGNIGVPISYDDFIRKIKKFGTVDYDLAENLKKIQEKAKIFDTKLLISLLEEHHVISDVKPYFILKPTNDPYFNALNKQIFAEFKASVFENPINAETVYNKLMKDLENLINKILASFDIKGIEQELPLTEAQKKELMTNFQIVNSLIDQRAKSIAVKYSDKIDEELIKDTKRHIYKIMAYYAVKNELQYFQYFFTGMKGIFSQLQDELKFSDIRQAFLFENILIKINSLDYQKIKYEIKNCGLIIFIIINNFLLTEKNNIPLLNKFDPMLFCRALGILILWTEEYTGLFISLLKNSPNYFQYFLNNENRSKLMPSQNYQNIQGRFKSFTDKVFQVDKCTNLNKNLK